MIEWIEPYTEEDFSIILICRMTNEDAIKASKLSARRSAKFKDKMDEYTDEMALYDFKRVHWAKEI